jgi:SAM-dependent methyltransferase
MKSLDTENAAQLHAQRKTMYEETDQYRNSFLDPNTGLLNEQYMEERSCPVCGSSRHDLLFTKNGGSYVRCTGCAMVFLNPVFTDASLTDYYRHNTTGQAAAHNSEEEFYRRIYTQGFEVIERHVKQGSVLDIGCSGGLFLDMARERGFSSYGIELNEREFEIVKAKGHTVWNTELSALDPQLKFDVVCLWDVFEHIKDGVAYLSDLSKRLNPGGVVFLQIPSADSFAARVLREQCNVFDGLEHVNLYGMATIAQVAKRSGFEVLELDSVIDELKPLRNYLSYEHPYQGSFKATPELDFLTPELIHEKKLGYKLQVLLRCKN